ERQHEEAKANAQQHGRRPIDGASLPDARNRWEGDEDCRRGLKFAPGLALLPGHSEGEFAVANAHGETLGKARCCLLAIGRHKLGKGGEQASRRHASSVDPVTACFSPGCVEITQRSSFLLMVRNFSRNPGRSRCHPMSIRWAATR